MAKLPFFKNSNLPDLTTLSLEELTLLHTHVGKHLVDRKEARIKELQAELRSLGAGDADGVGIKPVKGGARKAAGGHVGNGKSMAGGELGNAKSAGGIVGNGKTRAKPQPVYRSPDGFEWSGRGAIPRVFKELGVTDKAAMEKYRIKAAG